MTVQSFLISSPELDLPPSGKNGIPARREITDLNLVNATLTALEHSESLIGHRDKPSDGDSEIKFKVKNDNLEENATFVFDSKKIKTSKGPAFEAIYKLLARSAKQ